MTITYSPASVWTRDSIYWTANIKICLEYRENGLPACTRIVSRFSCQDVVSDLRTMFPTWGQCFRPEDHVFDLRTMFPTWGQCFRPEDHVSDLRTMFPTWGPCFRPEDHKSPASVTAWAEFFYRTSFTPSNQNLIPDSVRHWRQFITKKFLRKTSI